MRLHATQGHDTRVLERHATEHVMFLCCVRDTLRPELGSGYAANTSNVPCCALHASQRMKKAVPGKEITKETARKRLQERDYKKEMPRKRCQERDAKKESSGCARHTSTWARSHATTSPALVPTSTAPPASPDLTASTECGTRAALWLFCLSHAW